jgi:hypothetical protein
MPTRNTRTLSRLMLLVLLIVIACSANVGCEPPETGKEDLAWWKAAATKARAETDLAREAAAQWKWLAIGAVLPVLAVGVLVGAAIASRAKRDHTRGTVGQDGPGGEADEPGGHER